jgi:uncharacterized RDD family membrane protein YckC
VNGFRPRGLVIRTPEGVAFSVPLAGPYTRFLAYAIDLVVVVAAEMLIMKLMSVFKLLGGDTVGDFAGAMATLVYFLLSMGYGIVLEWFWGGKTIGKWLLRLRVMDAAGLRLKFNQVFMRNLLRAVDMLPLFYLVGGLACALSRLNQRLGDYVANTVVVRTPPPAAFSDSLLAVGKYNSLRDLPHIEARLRQQTTPTEVAVAIEAILRRDSLDPAARLALFGELAGHFREKAAFPETALLGLTDEQFVRNIVDSLYRGQAG